MKNFSGEVGVNSGQMELVGIDLCACPVVAGRLPDSLTDSAGMATLASQYTGIATK